MDITTYSGFRQNMKAFPDAVVASHKPLFITRKQGDDLVVLSKDDYTSSQETLYLLSNPNNSRRLCESISRQLEKGALIES
jgi:antitoxin YefM